MFLGYKDLRKLQKGQGTWTRSRTEAGLSLGPAEDVDGEPEAQRNSGIYSAFLCVWPPRSQLPLLSRLPRHARAVTHRAENWGRPSWPPQKVCGEGRRFPGSRVRIRKAFSEGYMFTQCGVSVTFVQARTSGTHHGVLLGCPE